MEEMMKRRSIGINGQVILFTGLRLVVNVAYRMVYPLLPVFARGLGVDLTAMSAALTTRSTVGMLGVFLAPLADRYGRRLSMTIGMLLVVLGLATVIIWPSFATFLIALILPNLGMQLLIPAMQAYLGDRVPYDRLGRAIGITEMSWALSSIVGFPVVAWLIARGGWSAPFPLLTGLAAVALLALVLLIPSDRPVMPHTGAIWRSFKTVLTNRIAVIALVFSLMSTIGNEIINFIFGVWLEDSFGLQIAALGAAAAVIGLSELTGASGSAWFSDRIGKEKAVRFGLALNCAAALFLPVIATSVPGATLGLFLFFITYEFMLVSSLPLMSEVLPEARATMMAMTIAMLAGGRALGDLLSPWFYHFGIWANVVACAVLNLTALGLLRWVRPAAVAVPSEFESGPTGSE